ncbi:23S rRNA (uracil(1939)-C(5))-methyltransferase RlmD [Crassaminicella thermophila]|uniref:23S rRNA (Uracil(1939)-C(5))-methyltransferase RlmD n=1 Tax=Crassaminicella thermophila TaxID=2599308 RepID=A0A5C0SHA7_CRATE|nr:23S rRNA (uracil(1939)-C(5))-methyltransferase RlmD [Crassaminicella thermophila]QEK13580.1 23S rRNA (uracil(1939)-C(5))-methyltransferase RlmD [Crassaminicella thermophila]
MVKKDQIYSMKIEDIGHKGEGIGKIEGFTVFADGGIVGDLVKVKITVVKKNYAVGKIIKIEEPSPDRIDPICSIAYVCGGCQIQHMDYSGQLRIKEKKVKDNLERIGKLKNVTIHKVLGMTNPYRYRNKAQFPVGTADKSVIGFYKRKTHDIVDIETCHIQHDVNDKIIKIIRDYINKHKISTYDEKTGKGLIRHILTKVGFTTGEIMVVIITNGKNLPNKGELIEALLDEIPQIKSIVQNINTKRTNRILGQECITLYGEDKIVDYIGDLKFNISPLSFFQVNPIQTKVLYEKALEFADLNGEETVYDIYCGIGTISLFLAQKAKYVHGIEIVDEAIQDAKENARINGIENVNFYTGAAEEVVPKLYEKGLKADVVVLDPPRKGCDEKVLDTIVNMNPERIVYVSCNPSTLARDLKYLDEKGYKAVEVQPVDMFPHTMHVESVVLIKRKHS